MRLASFRSLQREGFGCLVGDQLLALSEGPASAALVSAGRLDAVPVTLIDLLRAGDAALRAASAIVRSVDADPTAHPDWLRPMSDVTLTAPIVPATIIAVGRNYRDHTHEGAMELPDRPRIFPKWPGTVIGPEEPIRKPSMTNQLDWEVELAVIIGRRASFVDSASALEYVAGYTIVNDVSARDIQLSVPEQLTLAKNFRSFTPMGAWIVTTDEIPDPGNVEIRSWVNGDLMQQGSTRDLIFNIPYLVSFLSRVLDLEVGDVVSTGTPAGVGLFRSPPRFLMAGDRVRMELGDGLCVLENIVVDENVMVDARLQR